MINRDWQDATVATLSGATASINEYGEPTFVLDEQEQPATRTIQVYLKIYSQTNVTDPRYTEVDEIALTKDREVTTSDRLTVDGIVYAVRYVIPSPRFTTLLLRRLP